MSKRAIVFAINAVLVLVIIGLITATWLPAIYSSTWFQHNRWVRVHLLHEGAE
jgi:hypothetical protein